MNAPSSPNGETPLTVRDAIDLFIAHDAKRNGRCERAARERDKRLRLFCESYGDKLITDCRAADLQFWLDANPRWKSDWTLLGALRSIQRPFNWLAKIGVISRNPFAGLTHPQGERGRPMEPRELRLLLRNTDACYRCVLIFLRYSGVRPGELRELEWPHIKFEQAYAILERHKTVRSRKDRGPRIIILHPICVKMLVWLYRRRDSGKYANIFLNSRGRPWTKSAIDLRLYRMRRRLGIDPSCKLYSARHAWATQLAMSGCDVATLAALLGHTNWQMSSHYVHVHGHKDHLRAALAKGFPG